MSQPPEDPSPESMARLQALMRLKRHEVPPPGFYRDFAPSVARRIERDERTLGDSPWTRLLRAAWLPRLAGANAWLVVGAAFLAFSGLRFALKSPPERTLNGLADQGGAPGMGLQLAGPGSPAMMGGGLTGSSLLQLDPSVLQPVQFPGSSNDHLYGVSPRQSQSAPGLYRVDFTIPAP